MSSFTGFETNFSEILTHKIKPAKITYPYQDNDRICCFRFTTNGLNNGKIKFANKIIQLDNIQIARLLRATLYEYRPKICSPSIFYTTSNLPCPRWFRHLPS